MALTSVVKTYRRPWNCEVDAVQWDGSHESAATVIDEFTNSTAILVRRDGIEYLSIDRGRIEGTNLPDGEQVFPGMWITKDDNGDFDVMTDYEFRMEYEEVEKVEKVEPSELQAAAQEVLDWFNGPEGPDVLLEKGSNAKNRLARALGLPALPHFVQAKPTGRWSSDKPNVSNSGKSAPDPRKEIFARAAEIEEEGCDLLLAMYPEPERPIKTVGGLRRSLTSSENSESLIVSGPSDVQFRIAGVGSSGGGRLTVLHLEAVELGKPS